MHKGSIISQVKPLKILISAYSCKPGEVSEPGVAWKQIEALIRRNRYTITIVTRVKNVSSIKKELANLGCNVTSVIGVDLPAWARFWKKGHLAMHVYYYIWQFMAFFVAKRLDANKFFDVVHHLSFMTLRTNMIPFLRPPSIVGPVGGAQIPPRGFEEVLQHPFKEQLRKLSIASMRLSPIFHRFLEKTDILLLANRNNFWVVPDRLRHKCFIRQIGWDIPPGHICAERSVNANDAATLELLRIYWGGRLIGWKGLEILLRSLPLVRDAGIKFRLDITGKGPDEKYFQSLVQKLGLENNVVFHGWLDKSQVCNLQNLSDVYVFTSLHETTGTALFEMMALGKPLVVVDYAGPGEIIAKGGALKISVGIDVNSSVNECAKHIVTLAENSDLRTSLGNEARAQLESTYSWEAYITYIEGLYETLSSGRRIMHAEINDTSKNSV